MSKTVKIIEEHIVPPNTAKVRLSDYGGGIFLKIPSRKGVKKAIKRAEVLLNGTIAHTGDWVQENDLIQLTESQTPVNKVYELAFPIVFEDEYLAVIHKPAGISVSGNQHRTVKNALPFNIKQSQAVDALNAPLPVHRLDAPTQGLLLIAKTAKANILLNRLFEQKTIQKRYVAVLAGATPETGIFDTPINDKTALTSFNTTQQVPSLRNQQLSLVNLFPQTGRTHQLRIHLSQAGFPIVGDKLYGKPNEILKHKGLFLAAVELKFIHPITEENLIVSISTPRKFLILMEREKRRWEKYQ